MHVQGDSRNCKCELVLKMCKLQPNLSTSISPIATTGASERATPFALKCNKPVSSISPVNKYPLGISQFIFLQRKKYRDIQGDNQITMSIDEFGKKGSRLILDELANKNLPTEFEEQAYFHGISVWGHIFRIETKQGIQMKNSNFQILV